MRPPAGLVVELSVGLRGVVDPAQQPGRQVVTRQPVDAHLVATHGPVVGGRPGAQDLAVEHVEVIDGAHDLHRGQVVERVGQEAGAVGGER